MIGMPGSLVPRVTVSYGCTGRPREGDHVQGALRGQDTDFADYRRSPSAVEPQPKVPLRKPGIQERKPGSLLGSSWLPGFLRDSSRGSKDLKISSTDQG